MKTSEGVDLNIELLKNRLSDYGPSGFALFETFVLELLRADANNKRFETAVHKRDFPFDGYAPDGIGDIKTPLAIEIVAALNPSRLRSILELHRNHRIIENEGLLIVNLRQGEKLTRYHTSLSNIFSTPIYIWDQSELQNLIDKHPKIALQIYENLFSVRLKTAVIQKMDDWRQQRDIVISQVVEKLNDGRISLFLGAGVSSSAGLPTWDNLLNRLFVSMLTQDEDIAEKNGYINSIVQRLRKIDGPSAITLARYIRKGMSASAGKERDKFIDSVTTQLYGLRNQSYAINSELIKEIVSLCAPTRSGAKVRGVVTYNFDDLLERALKDRDIEYRTIFEEHSIAETEELPIYHVHGFLPEKRTEYANIDQSTLVFSEEGYHQIYRDAYHWSNLIQLNSLKDTSCLMVGLSLTDPNLRRLLEISTKTVDKPRHFAFLKRIDESEFTKESKNGQDSPVRAPLKMIRDFLNGHHRLNEEVLRELGVSVIWYEEYSEIPTILKRMRKTI